MFTDVLQLLRTAFGANIDWIDNIYYTILSIHWYDLIPYILGTIIGLGLIVRPLLGFNSYRGF